MATVLPVYPTTRRNVELLLVVLAVVIAGGAWAVVGLTIDGSLPPNLFAYAGGLGGLAILLHLLLRWKARHADPLLLPVATLLNGIGLVMIHRLDEALDTSSASRQFLWTALGIVAAGVVLVRGLGHGRGSDLVLALCVGACIAGYTLVDDHGLRHAAPIGYLLLVLIVAAVPGVAKAVKWNSPFYGVEEGTWFLSFHCFAKYVKVAFFRGAALDPLPPVGSKQPEVRYLHIHDGEALDESLIVDWVSQASRRPGERM